MSYNSRRIITTIIAGVILFIAYIVYATRKYAEGMVDLKSWAITILIFIGISVAVMIVIQILFHIIYAMGIAIKEQDQDDKQVERIIESSMVEDERDKIIKLKSERGGYICAGIGFLVALALFASGQSAILGLNVLLIAFFCGSLVEGILSIRFYERGV